MMTRLRIRVYLAGPISLGDPDDNVRRAAAVGLALLAAGFAPLIPQLTHLIAPDDVRGTVGYERWLESDLSFITVCDAVLRLPGESLGADRETRWAESLGIPVFTSTEALKAHFAGRR